MNISRLEKHQHWESILEAWKVSGLTITAFCAENKIAVDKFHYWKKKLADKQLPTAGFKEFVVPSPEGSGVWFDFGNGAKLVVDDESN